jgi:hypothetical protein
MLVRVIKQQKLWAQSLESIPLSRFNFENGRKFPICVLEYKIKLLLRIKEKELGLVLWVYRYWTPHA